MYQESLKNLILIISKIKSEIRVVFQYKALILRSEFVEKRFWRALLPDHKATKGREPVWLNFVE